MKCKGCGKRIEEAHSFKCVVAGRLKEAQRKILSEDGPRRFAAIDSAQALQRTLAEAKR